MRKEFFWLIVRSITLWILFMTFLALTGTTLTIPIWVLGVIGGTAINIVVENWSILYTQPGFRVRRKKRT